MVRPTTVGAPLAEQAEAGQFLSLHQDLLRSMVQLMQMAAVVPTIISVEAVGERSEFQVLQSLASANLGHWGATPAYREESELKPLAQ